MTGASKCHQNFGTKKRYLVNLPKQEDNPPSTARYLQPILQYLNKNLAKVFKYSPKSSSRNFSKASSMQYISSFNPSCLQRLE